MPWSKKHFHSVGFRCTRFRAITTLPAAALIYSAYLSDALYRSFTIDGNHFVLLNSVCNWKPPSFGLGPEQMSWLRKDLAAAIENKQSIVVFMHAYPSEHDAESHELAALFKQAGVLLVEMGHTHYNEIANDGQTIYAATRSTGQVEEGPPGFSIGSIDGGVVSWKFKPLGESSLVMITSPCDERLIIDAKSPAQVVRGTISVHARVWSCGIETVTMAIGETVLRMESAGDGCTWIAEFDSTTIPDGSHVLEVTAVTSARSIARDRISILVNQQGHCAAPQRRPLDYENAFGEWPEKHLLGTQLGPNEQGRHWPSRHERERLRS